jgi:ketosteroid isomerase-like protein
MNSQTTQTHTANEAQIRRLIEDRGKAVLAKDIIKSMHSYESNVLMFDVVNPLQYKGSNAVRKRAEEWFSLYQSPIGYEIRDLNITAGDDVAFCHYLYRVSGAMTDGGKVSMWVRATVCFRKIGGAWMITHEHDSVPFNPESGKASLDLKP